MKILLISDTHGRTEVLSALLQKHGAEIGMLCHTGDGCRDIARYESRFPHIKMIAVAGNSDYSALSELEYLITLETPVKTLRVFMTHGHMYGVKRNLDSLRYAALEKKADACFFGHTHNPVVFEQDGILFMNPGSLGFPHEYNVHTYGLAEVTGEGKIIGNLCEYHT